MGTALTHFSQDPNAYEKTLFLRFRSVFDVIIPNKLEPKLDLTSLSGLRALILD